MISLDWMVPEAPYMPIASIGLLSALSDANEHATLRWVHDDGGERLVLDTRLTLAGVANAVVVAPWPNLDAIPWSTKLGQAIKPMLGQSGDPVGELRRLRAAVDRDAGLGEQRLLRALVCDGALDDAGIPSRNRLLRGVKADLSGIAEKVVLAPTELEAELASGLRWRNGKTGRALGFAPEVQTFGGTTGRDPSSVGSHSALLYRLLWLGILALPPVAIARRGSRTVGGPLVTGNRGADVTLSWPIWAVAVDLAGLKALFTLPEIHFDESDHQDRDRVRGWAAARGVSSIYRVTSTPINSMIGAFRWGTPVL